MIAATEAYCPGWTVRAMSLGGVVPAVADRRRRTIFLDPPRAHLAREAVCRLLTELRSLSA